MSISYASKVCSYFPLAWSLLLPTRQCSCVENQTHLPKSKVVRIFSFLIPRIQVFSKSCAFDLFSCIPEFWWQCLVESPKHWFTKFLQTLLQKHPLWHITFLSQQKTPSYLKATYVLQLPSKQQTASTLVLSGRCGLSLRVFIISYSKAIYMAVC